MTGSALPVIWSPASSVTCYAIPLPVDLSLGCWNKAAGFEIFLHDKRKPLRYALGEKILLIDHPHSTIPLLSRLLWKSSPKPTKPNSFS